MSHPEEKWFNSGENKEEGERRQQRTGAGSAEWRVASFSVSCSGQPMTKSHIVTGVGGTVRAPFVSYNTECIWFAYKFCQKLILNNQTQLQRWLLSSVVVQEEIWVHSTPRRGEGREPQNGQNVLDKFFLHGVASRCILPPSSYKPAAAFCA